MRKIRTALRFCEVGFLSRRRPDCGIPMLVPVGLRFGSLRPAPGSRHLPLNGVQNQRIRRLPAEAARSHPKRSPIGASIGMAQGSLGD